MKPFLMISFAVLASLVPAQAQVTVQYSTSPAATIPDRGQYVSALTIAHAGIAEITDVSLSLSLISPSASNPMWLGDMYASLTHGTASEGVRSATVFNYFSTNPNNSDTALNASYNFATQFDGAWLASNKWSLLVADRAQGGVGQLGSWGLNITGTGASSGIMDPGQGGTVTAAALGTQTIGATVRSTGTGANAVTLVTDSGRALSLTGGVSGAGTLIKTGAGSVEIGGNSSFTGRVEVNQGDLVVGAGANLGPGSSVRVNSGGRLRGVGTIGALTVASGGRLAPGNSPGQLNVSGNTTWAGGGIYDWEINNFLGSAGTNWDFLNIGGTLDITATYGNQFLINVISLLASSNTAGEASGFSAQYDYMMAIATAAGGITGFDSSKFVLDLGSFANSRDYAPWQNLGNYAPGSFNLSLSQDSKTLYLNYARAIPEPNSASLVLLGLGIAYLRRRRSC